MRQLRSAPLVEEDDKMLDIKKWIALFLEQYRFEALKLGPKDKECLARANTI